LANWTPESFIGHVFKTIGKYVPPVPGVKSPASWGTQSRLQELFGSSIKTLRAVSREFNFRYRSPQHWVDVFRGYYGPVNRTYATLDLPGQDNLTRDLLALITRFNRSGDDTMVVPSEYLEIVIER
jgi:hypothetical protein